MSRKIHENAFLAKNLAIAIALASSMMFIRADLILWAFSPVLAKSLTIPFVIGLLVGQAYIIFLYFGTKYENIPNDVEFKNPYDLKEALFMGLVFGFVLAIVELTDKYSGSYGVYAVSFISGIADVDAIILSLSSFADSGINMNVTYNAIVVAIVSNTIAKSVLVAIFGNKAVFKEVFIYYLLSVGSFAISSILLY
jgi:uncharacterized membrane protein (DUF4010 family)